MPTTPLPDRVLELLRRPDPAVMATLAADGRPRDRGHLVSARGRRPGPARTRRDPGRLRHMRAGPRVSLTVPAADDWYTHVSLQGRVDSIADDEGLRDIDRLARHYTGTSYPTYRPRRRLRA